MGDEPNHSLDKVRQLQTKLWAAAKQSPNRRFHALYDRISGGDVLEQAWKRVRENRGAAGVDRQTLADVEAYGVDRLLAELKRDLEQKTYRPQRVLRRYIEKPDGGARPLGIPTVRDRIAQQAAKMILEPIFEADFLPSSFGYRPRLSPTDALERIRTQFPRGYTHVLDADISDFLFLLLLATVPQGASADDAMARAQLRDPSNNPVGVVKLTEEDGQVLIRANITNLDPGFHGFHVHTTGACSPNFNAAGGHYNPGGTPHGSHAGDLPSILVNSDRTGQLTFKTDRFTLADLLAGDGAPSSFTATKTTSPTYRPPQW